jgi:hypothetical protein
MSATGFWEGKLIDATGPTALIQLDLKSSRGKVEGGFQVTFLPPPDVDCGETIPRMVASGPVSGSEDKKGGIRVRSKLETAGTGVVVEFRAVPGEAAPHARRALYGSYAVLEGADALAMQGGACVLWQYVGGSKRKAG